MKKIIDFLRYIFSRELTAEEEREIVSKLYKKIKES